MGAKKTWTFKARFRAGAYGWHGTKLASQRLQEAVREIKGAAKSDRVAAAEGVICLFERLWPALEHIDNSSGFLGNAVQRTIEALLPILIAAPADFRTRKRWLDRLYQAVCDDGVSYLTQVEDHWGEICAYPELMNEWADVILPMVREAWGSGQRGIYVHGTSICLSCLLATGRYDELLALLKLKSYLFWPYDSFWGAALARQGKVDEAIAFAESSRVNLNNISSQEIDPFCENILLEAGRRDEAYRRYGLKHVEERTYLNHYRSIVKRYPERDPRQILQDLMDTHRDKGMWFAAAKDAGFWDIATECAACGTVEPATLVRAARDYAISKPDFAAQAALCAIKALLDGKDYTLPNPLDVVHAYEHLMTAATTLGRSEWAVGEIKRLLSRGGYTPDPVMQRVLTARLNNERPAPKE